jgi:hypothetical protein
MICDVRAPLALEEAMTRLRAAEQWRGNMLEEVAKQG